MLDVSALGAFASQQRVQLGETSFQIEKMPARQAHRVWREALNAIGHSEKLAAALGAVDVTDGNDAAAVVRVLQGILSLDVDVLERIQVQLFAFVKFTNQMAQSPQTVTGAEDTAYVGLEPFDLDELFARAFAVNFTPSLQRIVSKLRALAPAEPPLNP